MLVTVLAPLNAYWMAHDEAVYAQRGRIARVEVVEVDCDGRDTSVDVELLGTEQWISTCTGADGHPLEVGRSIPVLYDPQNLERLRRSSPPDTVSIHLLAAGGT